MSFKLFTILIGGSLGIGYGLYNIVGTKSRNMSEEEMMKKFGISRDHVRRTKEGNQQRYNELIKLSQSGNK
ncbi:hypothetical protein ACF0H5_003827 [Mactra antiquata]